MIPAETVVRVLEGICLLRDGDDPLSAVRWWLERSESISQVDKMTIVRLLDESQCAQFESDVYRFSHVGRKTSCKHPDWEADCIEMERSLMENRIIDPLPSAI